MAIDLQAMQDELARNTSLTGSIKAFTESLKNQVDALTTQLSQAGVDPATLSALADMQATLKANDDTVAAIISGTPAAGGQDTTGGAASGADTTGGAGADTTGGGAQAPSQAPADPNAPAGPTS